jgi:hypothetical protein
MKQFENDVRLIVYRFFVSQCRAPNIQEVAGALGTDRGQVKQAFENLAQEHILALQQDTAELLMAMPFSAVETSFRVGIGDSKWYANCAWDALGVPAMLSEAATVYARCPVSNDKLQLRVRSGELEPGQISLVHFAVPAASWWEDIAYT